jgi:hypothetical protein
MQVASPIQKIGCGGDSMASFILNSKSLNNMARIIIADVYTSNMGYAVESFFRDYAVEWIDTSNLKEHICRIEDIEDIAEYEKLSPKHKEKIEEIKSEVKLSNASYIRLVNI